LNGLKCSIIESVGIRLLAIVPLLSSKRGRWALNPVSMKSGEDQSGWTSFRSAFGQQWNNVIEDSIRPRLEQTYGKFGGAWKRPVWHEITLTYAHNSLNSTLEPLSIAPQQNYSHSLESALAYNGMGWNTRLASTYILESDLLRGGADYTVRMQTFTATFRPLDPLTISPTLGYRDEVRDWSGVRIHSP